MPVVVLEVPVTKRVEPLDEPMRESVRALESHPGFQYLLGKLRVQRMWLGEQLKQRQPDMRTVDILQTGLFWTGWLESQLHKETEREKEKVQQTVLTQPELEAIEAAQKAIEIIG